MDGYTCLDCNAYHDDYNTLKHYSVDSGGFCRQCGGDNLIADSERNEDEQND